MTRKMTTGDSIPECVEFHIRDWKQEDLVRLAVFSTELVINLYLEKNNAPKTAIQTAKNWLENPTEENKNLCQEAAYAAGVIASVAAAAGGIAGDGAYDISAAVCDAANAAYKAAYNATYKAAYNVVIDASATNTYLADTNTDLVVNFAARAADDAGEAASEEITQKIADYINDKNSASNK